MGQEEEVVEGQKNQMKVEEMEGLASLMVGLLGLLKGPSALELRTHSLLGNFTAFPGFELVEEGRNMEGRVGVRDIFEYRNRIGGWML